MPDITVRAALLTQRLDHSIPDPEMPFAFNRKAAEELGAIADKLLQVLPDPSLSPLERIERLSRVIEQRTPNMDQLMPAHKKVAQIKDRLDALIPGDDPPLKKIDRMLEILDEIAPVDLAGASSFAKLESLGDPRGKVEPE